MTKEELIIQRTRKFVKRKQFEGEQIFDNNSNFVSIRVIKGGAKKEDIHGVDAITGGTITSNGVSEMLERTLNLYVPYFKKAKIN